MADVAPAVTTPKKATKKRTPGAGKAKAPANHPTYESMIQRAITTLKEHKGSSRHAILKYIMANFKVGNDARSVNAHLKLALRRGAKSGVLKHIGKGTGASGRFRIGEKKAKAPKKARKPATKKTTGAAKKKQSPKKKAAGATTGDEATTKTKKAKKTTTKPKSPKKTAATKKPKSSPKTKKTKKAATKRPAVKKTKKSPKKTTKKTTTPAAGH